MHAIDMEADLRKALAEAQLTQITPAMYETALKLWGHRNCRQFFRGRALVRLVESELTWDTLLHVYQQAQSWRKNGQRAVLALMESLGFTIGLAGAVASSVHYQTQLSRGTLTD